MHTDALQPDSLRFCLPLQFAECALSDVLVKVMRIPDGGITESQNRECKIYNCMRPEGSRIIRTVAESCTARKANFR